MLTDQQLIYHLPFDEPLGSLRAYDYSRTRSYADLTPDATYLHQGRHGRALEFDGNATATSPAAISLAGDLTIALWHTNLDQPTTTTPDNRPAASASLIMQDTANTTTIPFLLNTDRWQHIAIVKQGLGITIYRDGTPVATAMLPAQPMLLRFDQPNSSAPEALAIFDDLRIYDTAATQQDIIDLINYRHPHTYTLDGLPFIPTYNTYVRQSSGLLDRPKRKTTLSHSWTEYHGKAIDLSTNILETRTITLDCFMPATDRIHFAWQWQALLDHLLLPGLHRLQLDIYPDHPLCYDVFLEDSLPVTKRWNDALMVGEFKLKLTEPEPLKTIIRFRVDNPVGETHEITLTTPKILNITWGDGTATNDIAADDTTPSTHTLRHTYTQQGIYYAVIHGDIPTITNLNHTGITVWHQF